jgi:type II secretion system protein C
MFIHLQQSQQAIPKKPLSSPITQLPVSAIPSWHLFGTADSNTVTTTTNLPLTLVGVMIRSETKASIAIIAESQQDEKSYHVNDHLPGGAMLYKILPDAVIIQRNGKLERLPLAQNEKNDTTATPAGDQLKPADSQLAPQLKDWQKRFGM